MKTNYEKQAEDFLNKTNTKFEVRFLRSGKYFDHDEEDRDIYQVTLTRGTRKYSFEFEQSLNKSGFYYTKGVQKINIERKHLNVKNLTSFIRIQDCDFMPEFDKIHKPAEPTARDVLACLQKYDVGSLENFCSDFGYDLDSKTGEKTYNAVCDEYNNIRILFSDSEIKKLQEIS